MGCGIRSRGQLERLVLLQAFPTQQSLISILSKDMCRLRDINPRKHLKKYAYGIVRSITFGEKNQLTLRLIQYYFFEFTDELLESDYWSQIYLNRDLDTISVWDLDDVTVLWKYYALVPGVSLSDLRSHLEGEDDPVELLHPVEDEQNPVEAYDVPGGGQIPLVSGVADYKARVSVWSGLSFVTRFDEEPLVWTPPPGIMVLTLPPWGESEGPVTGFGMDGAGDFYIEGYLHGESIVYNQRHSSGRTEPQRYQGKLTTQYSTIGGDWGSLGDLGDNFNTSLEGSKFAGSFQYSVVGVRISSLEPSDSSTGKYRALWDFAIKSTLTLVKARHGHLTSVYVKERKRVTKRFLELSPRLVEDASSGLPYDYRSSLSDDEITELAGLIALCSERDVGFYRRLSAALERRRINHW